jgi:hypothetical protein
LTAAITSGHTRRTSVTPIVELSVGDTAPTADGEAVTG